MKKEFCERPENFKEQWEGELSLFSWMDFLTAIPAPLFLVTSYKANGKSNACLQSWSTFVGDAGEFLCIMGSVSKRGHLYETLQHSKDFVINFMSADIYDKCATTIEHNNYEEDEIINSGLTIEQATSVKAPRIKECFLNLECEVLWEKEHFEGSRDVIVCGKVKLVVMDENNYDDSKLGRYGKTGYMYNVNSPRNPENGEVYETCFGALDKYKL